MPLFFYSNESRKKSQIDEEFFARSRYSHLELPFVFVFVNSAKRYSLENFSSRWCAVVVGINFF
jgi:hypothetical protein